MELHGEGPDSNQRAITETQAEARRQNGRKSKGPTTEAGKERPRVNATKHGAFARLRGAVPQGPLAEDVGAVEEMVAVTAFCATRNAVRGTNPMPSPDEAAEGWPERLLPVIWVVDRQGEVRSELDPLYRFLRYYVLLRQEVLHYFNR